jgi:hypothetical protein
MKLSGIALFVAIAVAATDSREFTDWSTPANIGAPVNTTVAELGPFLSRDGLTLYFGRGGTATALDIWVWERASVNDPWQTPQNLGPNVNTPGIDNNPGMSLDEHWLYFNSNRPGGFGNNDLYASRRHNRRDALGWEPPMNLGNSVNSSANDTSPTFFEDETTGVITMYFDSDRPGMGGADIYASTLLSDGTFSPAVLVEELSSTSIDRNAAVRRDGLEIFLDSDRPGTLGLLDIMVSTRAATSDPWSPPVHLGANVNSAFIDSNAALSFDGTVLLFQSTANRPGATGPCSGDLGPCVFDLYVTSRAKLKKRDK